MVKFIGNTATGDGSTSTPVIDSYSTITQTREKNTINDPSTHLM